MHGESAARGETSSILAGRALAHADRRGDAHVTSAVPRHHRHTRDAAVSSSHGPRSLASISRGTPALVDQACEDKDDEVKGAVREILGRR